MNYFAIEYPNHVTLLMKSGLGPRQILYKITLARGLDFHGTIYNPQSFLSFRQLRTPDDRQKLIAQSLNDMLIGN